MIYNVIINNKEYEVEVDKGQANLLKTNDVIHLEPVVQTVKSEIQPVQTTVPTASTNIGGESIKSPLPGTILDIKVSTGAKVKRGQLLLIIEAMKMENEIVAPKDGIVSQVIVSKGANVATNDLLMVIE